MLDITEVDNALILLILRVLLSPLFGQSEDGIDILLLKGVNLLTAPDIAGTLSGIVEDGYRRIV